MNFKDKVVVVTGSAQGIGRAAAEAFAREGASVIVNDVDETRLNQTAYELRCRASPWWRTRPISRKYDECLIVSSTSLDGSMLLLIMPALLVMLCSIK